MARLSTLFDLTPLEDLEPMAELESESENCGRCCRSSVHANLASRTPFQIRTAVVASLESKSKTRPKLSAAAINFPPKVELEGGRNRSGWNWLLQTWTQR